MRVSITHHEDSYVPKPQGMMDRLKTREPVTLYYVDSSAAPVPRLRRCKAPYRDNAQYAFPGHAFLITANAFSRLKNDGDFS